MTRLTHRRVALGIALVLATGVCAAASASFADGNDAGTAVKFGAETWYQPDPTCQLPTDCLSTGVTLPAVNPYGAGTLHVAVDAGQETARTYLAVNAVAISPGLMLTSATFTAPLDTSAIDGSLAPDTSTTHVCESSATITADEGEFNDPPTTLCSPDADLEYTATPAPELTGDITDLINAHLADLVAGKLDLAILPLGAAQSATWNDVFSSDDRTSTGPATPTLTLTFASTDSTAPRVTTGSVPSTASATAPSMTPTASTTGAPGSVPTARTPEPDATIAPQPPPAAALAPALVAAGPSPVPSPILVNSEAAGPVPTRNDPAIPTETVAASRTVGFAYPTVLLLPLVLLAAGVALARVMTRNVAPKLPRRL